MAFDVVIRGGTVYDGTGGAPVVTDLAIAGDEIVRLGPVSQTEIADAGTVVDAARKAVAPGFINVLSHAYVSMYHDGRSMGDLKQGVTTQLFGEGMSVGPVTPATRPRLAELYGEDVPWESLREFLACLEGRGVSQNVASLIGATTLRMYAAGYDDRPLTERELEELSGVIADEMTDGAMGIGSALIYAPGFYASTDELVALARAAGRYGGKYFSHLRSEGDAWEQGIEELLHISRAAELPGEVWHLKAAGRQNWSKMDAALDTLEAVRDAGEPITADMYPYTAGGTALAACVPPRFAVGGSGVLRVRLGDSSARDLIAKAIAAEEGAGWENLYLASGGAEGVFIAGVRLLDGSDDALVGEVSSAVGGTLADYAKKTGRDPVDAALYLIEHTAYVGCMYFIIDEANIAKAVARPWIAVGSDAASQAVDDPKNAGPTHPRGYGTFARFLGRYCRDAGLAPLTEGIHRMTGLPASTLELDRRGQIREGWFADIVVFDPDDFIDVATYEDPHRYAVGMHHVFVNGVHTLRDGEHTGTFGGRALTGPGRR